mmetsp:Transcript_85725/g.239650  ORF Transcript_85725/g.239650 Transcript_85725/m.239650 type:complete len:663 (-) Transcript_85725:137-2125(-)
MPRTSRRIVCPGPSDGRHAGKTRGPAVGENETGPELQLAAESGTADHALDSVASMGMSVGTPCVFDETCICANRSLVRELVNVTLEGVGCYACEPQRLPACTEAQDQCTPEACDCADPSTHAKHSAVTADGTPCHYCEPFNGYGGSVGMSELMMVIMIVSIVLTIHFVTRRPPPGGNRNGLRLARRQGDRGRAIRVHQEKLSWTEEIIGTLADAFDALGEGVCDLISGLWCAVRLLFGTVASGLAEVSAFFYNFGHGAAVWGRCHMRGWTCRRKPQTSTAGGAASKTITNGSVVEGAGARRRTRRKDAAAATAETPVGKAGKKSMVAAPPPVASSTDKRLVAVSAAKAATPSDRTNASATQAPKDSVSTPSPKPKGGSTKSKPSSGPALRVRDTAKANGGEGATEMSAGATSVSLSTTAVSPDAKSMPAATARSSARAKSSAASGSKSRDSVASNAAASEGYQEQPNTSVGGSASSSGPLASADRVSAARSDGTAKSFAASSPKAQGSVSCSTASSEGRQEGSHTSAGGSASSAGLSTSTDRVSAERSDGTTKSSAKSRGRASSSAASNEVRQEQPHTSMGGSAGSAGGARNAGGDVPGAIVGTMEVGNGTPTADTAAESYVRTEAGPAAARLIEVRTFWAEPAPKVVLRHSASESALCDFI